MYRIGELGTKYLSNFELRIYVYTHLFIHTYANKLKWLMYFYFQVVWWKNLELAHWTQLRLHFAGNIHSVLNLAQQNICLLLCSRSDFGHISVRNHLHSLWSGAWTQVCHHLSSSGIDSSQGKLTGGVMVKLLLTGCALQRIFGLPVEPQCFGWLEGERPNFCVWPGHFSALFSWTPEFWFGLDSGRAVTSFFAFSAILWKLFL